MAHSDHFPLIPLFFGTPCITRIFFCLRDRATNWLSLNLSLGTPCHPRVISGSWGSFWGHFWPFWGLFGQQESSFSSQINLIIGRVSHELNFLVKYLISFCENDKIILYFWIVLCYISQMKTPFFMQMTKI